MCVCVCGGRGGRGGMADQYVCECVGGEGEEVGGMRG